MKAVWNFLIEGLFYAAIISAAFFAWTGICHFFGLNPIQP